MNRPPKSNTQRPIHESKMKEKIKHLNLGQNIKSEK